MLHVNYLVLNHCLRIKYLRQAREYFGKIIIEFEQEDDTYRVDTERKNTISIKTSGIRKRRSKQIEQIMEETLINQPNY
jgi:hypothetical protein